MTVMTMGCLLAHWPKLSHWPKLLHRPSMTAPEPRRCSYKADQQRRVELCRPASSKAGNTCWCCCCCFMMHSSNLALMMLRKWCGARVIHAPPGVNTLAACEPAPQGSIWPQCTSAAGHCVIQPMPMLHMCHTCHTCDMLSLLFMQPLYSCRHFCS